MAARLSLRSLRYFVAAAETGSITAAAARVHVSQPSVSEAIARLEADLGVQLFLRRQSRGLALTVPGDRFLVQARNLLSHADEVERFADHMGDLLSGELRVGCFVTLAPFVLPALLAGFARAYPGISVSFEEANQLELLERLREGRCELAMTYAYGLGEEFASEVLAELPPRVVLAADDPRARRRSISLRELADAPMVLLDLPHTRDYFLSLFRSAQIEPRIAHRAHTYETVRGLVARGLGFTILNAIPRQSLTYDGGRVAAVPIAEELPKTLAVSLRSKKLTPRPTVTAFAEYTRGFFADTWPTIVEAPGRKKRQ
ncbi:MAG: LysR family transcriptional regulator [Burkholderiales bacterium]